jgi:hypothetical protein
MDPWEAAHRSALDHVLGLIAESPWADALVLRGSMTMPAWVGAQARLPGDLDWVVPPISMTRPDDLSPWPFVDRIDPAQHWPEAVHGGARNEIWTFEEFDTGGLRPRLPPEGLHWMTSADLDDQVRPHDSIEWLIREHNRTPEGVVLDLDQLDGDVEWDYADYGPAEGIRARLRIPWTSPSDEAGVVQLDFAYDEVLPEHPVLTAVPRSAGRGPVGMWTAGRELSLAWKLHWLAADQADSGMSAAKDVYDAVLLAELPGIRLPARLHQFAMTGASSPLTPAAVLAWTVDGPLPGGHSAWLERLAAALPGLIRRSHSSVTRSSST